MAIAHDLVEETFSRNQKLLILHDKRATGTQLNVIADFRLAPVTNRERIDFFLKRLVDRASCFDFRQVTECIEIVDFNRCRKKVVAYKFFDLLVEHVVATDEVQIVLNHPRKETDGIRSTHGCGTWKFGGMRYR